MKYSVLPPEDGHCLRSLRACRIANRDPRLPPLYTYIGRHPQVPENRRSVRTGTTYVYLVDTTSAGKDSFAELSRSMQVPRGAIGQDGSNKGRSCYSCAVLVHNALLGLLGLLRLSSGDAVFARDVNGSGDASEDAIQAFVGDV